jgi:hypothetical protein
MHFLISGDYDMIKKGACIRSVLFVNLRPTPGIQVIT